MKKNLIIVTGIILLQSCNIRSKEKHKVDTVFRMDSLAATSVIVIDTVYNFGKVTDGELVEYNFRFKNSGNKPLVITNATASCGCTVPEKPEEPIMPNETGYIKVKFNSEHRVGLAHKTIRVESNANPPFPELLLTGNVLPKDTLTTKP